MQVSVEKTDNALERKLRIQVPADKVASEIEQRLRRYGKQARLNGFRPGKAPMRVIEKQFGDQARQEVLTELIQTSYTEALIKENLKPAGSPRIGETKAQPGAALEYTATIELYPEITLEGLDGIQVERTVVDITDADVDQMIESLRKQRASWNAVERAAADGDQVTTDFEGKLDGEVFPGGLGKKVEIVLGEGRFLAGFEKNLAGVTTGEVREFDLEFPSDYQNEQLAGKTAQFTATVISVAEQVLPDVDDAFCAGFGVEEGGIEKLKSDVRANMQAELDQNLRRKLKLQVLDALLAANPITLPGSLVQDELRRLKMEAMQRMGANSEKDMPDLPDEIFMEQAQRRVSLGLLVAEVIRNHEIKLDQDRLHGMLHALAETYDDPKQVLDAYNRNPRLMEGLEAMTMEEQVVDLVLSQAVVTEKSSTFKEVMNANQ